MTNAEKFKAVFGMEFHEMDEIRLKQTYRKELKMFRYRLIDDPHGIYRKEIKRGIVIAGGKKAARELAIEEVGDEYKRYIYNNVPQRALLIEEV